MSKYYFDVPNGNPNFSVEVAPIDDEGSFTLECRYHFFTGRWYCKLTYTNLLGTEVSTGWRQIGASNSLNFEYQYVMPCSLGCEALDGLEPDDIDDLNGTDYKFFLLPWDEL